MLDLEMRQRSHNMAQWRVNVLEKVRMHYTVNHATTQPVKRLAADKYKCRTYASWVSKIMPHVKQCLMLANSISSTLRIKQAVNTDAMIQHPI